MVAPSGISEIDAMPELDRAVMENGVSYIGNIAHTLSIFIPGASGLSPSRDSRAGPMVVRPNFRSPVCTSARSEEHTSELQSRPHLVCRLLLEKKKLPEKLIH